MPMMRRTAALVLALVSLAQLPAFAQGGSHRPISPEERRGLRQDIDYMRREPGAERPLRSPEETEARRAERARLREAINQGHMTREQAIEQYRGRFSGPYGGRQMSPEDREKLRRDLIDAHRERELGRERR